MNTTVVTVLVVPLLISAFLLGIARSNPAVSAGNADKVVIVSCRVGADATPLEFREIKVAGASSSANAPQVPTGGQTNCAQTLAMLLNAGFAFVNVEGGASGALYTLRQGE